MAEDLPPMLRFLLQRLISALAPEQIILFGSYARGTARAGSDIDLLIVGEWQGETTYHLRRGRLLVARSFPPVDLVLCTPADIAEAEAGRAPFLLSVIESGTTVYRRS